MGGTFSKDNRPLLPGAYFNVEAVSQAVVPVNYGSIVAVPITHTWGPVETPTLCQSFATFEAIFGKDASAGRTAVEGAFLGENVPGWGGAGAVLVYRMTGSSAASASKILTNTTPATAVTLTARYAGSRGNRLKVAVTDTAGAAANTDVILYDDTVEIERYTFADNDTQSLVTQVNAVSQWVTATYAAAGPLTLIATPTALTGGDDGSTLIAGDYTTMMSALGIERFAIFAPQNLTDSAIIESIRVWARDLNAAGKRFRCVFGGGDADTATLAIARSEDLRIGSGSGETDLRASANIVNLGAFLVEFSDGSTLNSAELAPRYAGILAQRGEVHSGTAARLGGATKILSGPSTSEKVAMFRGGAVGVGRDSDPVSPIRFEAAVTTFTESAGTTQSPYTIFRNPKFVATMQGIEMEVTEYAESNVIGKVPINDKTRDALRGEMLTRLERRVDAGIIQPNPTVMFDNDPPPTALDEFVAFIYGIRFGRTVEQVYGTLRVA